MGTRKTGGRGPVPKRSFTLEIIIISSIILIILGCIMPHLVAEYDTSRRCVRWIQYSSRECTATGCTPVLKCTERE